MFLRAFSIFFSYVSIIAWVILACTFIAVVLPFVFQNEWQFGPVLITLAGLLGVGFSIHNALSDWRALKKDKPSSVAHPTIDKPAVAQEQPLSAYSLDRMEELLVALQELKILSKTDVDKGKLLTILEAQGYPEPLDLFFLMVGLALYAEQHNCAFENITFLDQGYTFGIESSEADVDYLFEQIKAVFRLFGQELSPDVVSIRLPDDFPGEGTISIELASIGNVNLIETFYQTGTPSGLLALSEKKLFDRGNRTLWHLPNEQFIPVVCLSDTEVEKLNNLSNDKFVKEQAD